MDYDFFHSDDMTSLSCGNDYQATVIPVDINIWISRLFLGDADGFSILHLAGQLFVCDGAHDARDVVDCHERHKCDEQTVTVGERGGLSVEAPRDVYVVPWAGGFAAVGVAAETDIKT